MNVEKFIEWLRKQGAEIMPTTNQYELVRFIARGQTNVIYEGRRGISAIGFANDCLKAYHLGNRLNMGFTQKPRSPMTKLRMALLKRDGDCCFYCGTAMSDPTVEHLVSRHKGGPDHQDNLVLVHRACNVKAGNMPLVEKIKMRDSLRLQNEKMRIGESHD